MFLCGHGIPYYHCLQTNDANAPPGDDYLAFYRRSLLYFRNNILFMEKIALPPPHLASICFRRQYFSFFWDIILSHLKNSFVRGLCQGTVL